MRFFLQQLGRETFEKERAHPVMEEPAPRTSLLFGCPETRVGYFSVNDDLNKMITIEGAAAPSARNCDLEGQVCNFEGPHFGSLSISTVGEAGCEPQLMYGDGKEMEFRFSHVVALEFLDSLL